jgi:archaellum biogenesis protein FlaJ (TadC family)
VVLEPNRPALYALHGYKECLMHENNKIGTDRWLQRLMKTGIPLAIVCILSLWLGQTLGLPLLGWVFVLTAPPVLLIGFAYNLRYLLLVQRRKRTRQS